MQQVTITDQQAENTRMAYAIMVGIPSKRIDLDNWRTYFPGPGIGVCNVSDKDMMRECGTAGCIAGWLSLHPYFKAQGLKYHFRSIVFKGDPSMIDASESLFGSAGMFSGGSTGKRGKLQALKRLRVHLLNAGRITPDRNDELALQEFSLV